VTRFSPESLLIYLVADPNVALGDVVEDVRASINNGVTCVQIRWKDASDRQFANLARQMLDICEPLGVPLVINDRIDIALAVGAQGVHLGVDDLLIEDARRLGGPEFIVGYSPESDICIARAAARGVTYLGIGPFAATRTKNDAGCPLGPAEFARRRILSTLPVVAIGGINAENARSALGAGANGIAVASAILGTADPAAATRRLLDATAPVRP
jgi:thiamine-phosphate pyrophosphorylase